MHNLCECNGEERCRRIGVRGTERDPAPDSTESFLFFERNAESSDPYRLLPPPSLWGFRTHLDPSLMASSTAAAVLGEVLIEGPRLYWSGCVVQQCWKEVW